MVYKDLKNSDWLMMINIYKTYNKNKKIKTMKRFSLINWVINIALIYLAISIIITILSSLVFGIKQMKISFDGDYELGTYLSIVVSIIIIVILVWIKKDKK